MVGRFTFAFSFFLFFLYDFKTGVNSWIFIPHFFFSFFCFLAVLIFARYSSMRVSWLEVRVLCLKGTLSFRVYFSSLDLWMHCRYLYDAVSAEV